MEVSVRQIAAILSGVKQDPALADRVAGSTDILNEIGLDSIEMTQFFLDLEEKLQLEIDYERLEPACLKSVDLLRRFLSRP